MRKSILALFIVLSLTPVTVAALGLGLIDLKSGLNQPLKAEIALLSVSESDLPDIRVTLAPPSAFTRAGVDRLFFLAQLKFKTKLNAKGKPVIVVTSRDSVKEPFLNFLVELNWPQGRFLREYTMLLDPPVTFEEKAAPQIAAPRKTRSTKTGSIRKSRIASTSTNSKRSKSKRTAAINGEHAVRRGDSLSKIAKQYRQDGKTLKQTMLAIFEANPDAFANKNINQLRAGVVLKVEDLEEISQEQALEAYNRQTTAWKEDQKEPDNEALDFQAESAQPIKKVAKTQETSAPIDVFKIDTPTTDGKTGSDNELPGEISDSEEIDALKRDFRLANEAAAAQERENEELRSRLGNVNEQVAKMERLLSLQSDEMASLQQRLIEQNVELSDELKAELNAALGIEETIETETTETLETQTDETETEVVVTSDPEDSKDESIVDEYLGAVMKQLDKNPLMIGGIGGGIVFFIIILMLLRRRKAKRLVMEESILAADDGIGETIITSTEPQSSGLSTDIIDDESFLSDISPTEMTGADELGDDVDPLAEADVYLAYGRYDQAEDLIQQAIDNEPDRADYKVKLLEVFYATKDEDKFNQLAADFQSSLDEQSKPLWDRVVTMGLDLSPDNALFSNQPAAATIDESDLDATVADLGDLGDLGEIDTDMDLGDLDLGSTPDDTNIDLGAGLGGDSVDLGNDLDLDLGTIADAPAIDDDFMSGLGDDTDLSAGLNDTSLEPGLESGLGGDTDLSVGLDETNFASDLGEPDLSAGDLSTGLDETDFSAGLDESFSVDSDLDVGELSTKDTSDTASVTDDLSVSLDAFDAGADYTSDYGTDDFSSSADAFDVPPTESSIEKASSAGLDLGNFGDSEDIDLGALGEPETSTASPDFSDEALGLSPSSSSTGSSEEIETKLELARVYVDMGDPEGARDILKEVLEEGDADQKQLAEEIINGI